MLAILFSILPLISLCSAEVNWEQSFRADLTCCPIHATDQQGCEAELGSNCVWVSTDHEGYKQTDSQCLGSKFEKCIKDNPEGCCGGCCDCGPKDTYKVPDAIKNPPNGEGIDACGTTPSPVFTITPPKTTHTIHNTPHTTQFTPIKQGFPEDVASQIDAARGTDDQCATITGNCWTNPSIDGRNADYSTVDVWFLGVSKNDNNNCCYKYASYYTGNKDCGLKSSHQSHLTFDIQCQAQDFEIVQADSTPGTTITYGNDGSTCYNGIKIDQSCADSCENYEICINFKHTNTCEYTESWVMDKAGNYFSFMSLDGIPTCEMPIESEWFYINGLFYDETQMGGISMIGWMCFIITIFIVVVIFKYKSKTDDKYIPIKDGNNDGYNTFSSV
eukprot:219254_1